MGRKKGRRIPIPARVEDALDTALDTALSVQRPVVLAYLNRVRDKNPGMTPAQAIEQLERRYVQAAIGIGGASGAAAAVPGIGTAASLASGAAEITAFVSASAMFVLALAELHSVPVSDPEVRRALVVAVLVGEGGAAVLAGAGAGPEDKHWGRVIGRMSEKDKDAGRLKGLNSRLGRMMITRFGARQGALMFGRALPLGLGAGVGAIGNRALARGAIASARRAFGPAPEAFPAKIIDAEVSA